MALVQQEHTTVGPVAIDGRTITLVARSRAVRFGRRRDRALHVRARPSHVEVLDAQGRRDVVRIRDVEGTLIAGIAVTGVVYVLGARVLRTMGRRAAAGNRR